MESSTEAGPTITELLGFLQEEAGGYSLVRTYRQANSTEVTEIRIGSGVRSAYVDIYSPIPNNWLALHGINDEYPVSGDEIVEGTIITGAVDYRELISELKGFGPFLNLKFDSIRADYGVLSIKLKEIPGHSGDYTFPLNVIEVTPWNKPERITQDTCNAIGVVFDLQEKLGAYGPTLDLIRDLQDPQHYHDVFDGFVDGQLK